MVKLPVPPPEKGFGGRQWTWVMQWIITNLMAIWNIQLVMDLFFVIAIIVLFVMIGRS